MKEPDNLKQLQPPDLFGLQDAVSVEEEKKQEAGLRQRILDFFKDRKYQTFTAADLFGKFAPRHPKLIRRSARALVKDGKLILTGELRGESEAEVDRQCMTLNLHRPE